MLSRGTYWVSLAHIDAHPAADAAIFRTASLRPPRTPWPPGSGLVPGSNPEPPSARGIHPAADRPPPVLAGAWPQADVRLLVGGSPQRAGLALTALPPGWCIARSARGQVRIVTP